MTKLYEFQKEGVRQIQSQGGVALLADEMGCGKTIQALTWAKKYLDRGPIVVVCPATIKINWQREARKHIDMRSIILERKQPPPGGLKSHPGKFYIINYDILGNPNDPNSWVNVLKSIHPQLVIADEVHYAKSRDSQRTKALRYLCRGVPHRVMISGTPLTNRPAELWPILNILKPKEFNSFWSYGIRYCDPRKTPWGWDMRGASNLEELHDILSSTLMIRRLKKDVMGQLPVKIRTVQQLEISDRKEYTQAETNFIKWLRTQSKKKATSAASAEKLVQMGYLKRLAASLKMKSVMKWIEDFLEECDDKLLIYGVHKSILDQIHSKYQKKAVLVTGEVRKQKRQNAIDRFNDDPSIRMMVGNVQAAGVGWSCTSAGHVLFVEMPWMPGELTQAEDRIHGIGRGIGSAQYYYLVARGTIEEKLVQILHKKQHILDQTLDGKAGISQFDILKLMEEELLKPKRKMK